MDGLFIFKKKSIFNSFSFMLVNMSLSFSAQVGISSKQVSIWTWISGKLSGLEICI